MAYYRPFALVVLFVVYATSLANSLSLGEFYPFGKKNGDAQLHRRFHKLVNLSAPVIFNGEAHNSLYVNSNGGISFNPPAPFSKHLTAQNFPNGHKLIAPYYSGLRTPRTGPAFYRETQEKQLLLLASAEVHAGFAQEKEFEATHLFIVTWLHVGLGNPLMNKTISFQAVLISDGTQTFALFHYNNEASEHRLPSSGTNNIFKLSQTSNVKIPGKWLYMIGSHSVTEPDTSRNGLLVNDSPVRRSTTDTCGEGGIECSEEAVCNKTVTECCVCNSGYYGNGKMCLKSGQSTHMMGKLSGTINFISVDGIRFSVFADVLSKTTFIALDPVYPLVSFSLRVFTPMVSTLGFLFAHSGQSSENGFSFLGDNFSRRSRVTFETGEVANIRETMLGKDQKGFYNFKIEIDGRIPFFDGKKEIKFDDYVHTYRYDRLGIMSGFYSATFNVDETKHKINVVEVLEFDEVEGCINVGSSKMVVSEQRSTYDSSTSVLNFALKTEMQDEGACGKGNRKCHRHAKCIVKNGVEFCDCNIGFQGDGFSCQDVDECLLNIHECSPNAKCSNTLGSYSCRCRDGFQGNGRICTKEEGRCGDEAKKCHSLAQCVTKNGEEMCECNVGYIAKEESCEDANECTLGIDQCSVNADCINTPGSYRCRCKDGYTGNGRTCQGIQIGSGDACTSNGQQCDPTEDCINGKCQCRNGFLHDGSSCKDADECLLGVHTCDKTASCANTVGSFKCTCLKGYTGDGYKCVPEVTVPLSGCHGKKCHDDGYCDRSGKVHVCRCNEGYSGDGVSCQDVNECDTDESRCHAYAICTNTAGSYTCQCRPGYKGDGRQCVYEDPCKDLSCAFNARCIIRDGSPKCQCYSGYYGDGRNCKDYNECEAERDTCDQNAKCVNTPGSYRCFCLPGYDGDGFLCKSDGSCGGSKCHRNARCVEVDGVKRCQCKPGFVGSGLICVDFDECSNKTLIKCPPFSHCFNTFGSFKCRCDTGYQWNGVECKPVCLRCLNGGQCLKSGCLCREGYSGERCQWVGDEFLVFAQGSTMQRLSLPPRQDTISILLQTTRGLLVAMDFDHMNKMIYFTDVARKAIWRVGFNGTGVEKIISSGLSSPEGIAVDYIGGNLYWSDSIFDRVEVSKLDGSDRKVLFSTRLINPRSIVVHPEKGTMYWADWNRVAPKIEVAHMDGGSRRVFIQQKMGLPNGLTLDRRNDELCWTDAMHGSISCANLDQGKSEVVYSAARYPFGVTSFGQYLIWTDWDARKIQQYDRQSYKRQPDIKSFPGSTGAFYEIKAVQKPENIDSHGCSKNNGGCSNLCLSNPGGRTCACADGFYLVSREKSLRLKSDSTGSGAGERIPSLVELSGDGSGSGVNPQSTPVTSLNSTLIISNVTVCVDEKNYKLIRNLL